MVDTGEYYVKVEYDYEYWKRATNVVVFVFIYINYQPIYIIIDIINRFSIQIDLLILIRIKQRARVNER